MKLKKGYSLARICKFQHTLNEWSYLIFPMELKKKKTRT